MLCRFPTPGDHQYPAKTTLRSDGGYGSEQDGSGAERLAAGDIEAGSGESGDAGGEGLLHGWSLGVPGASRVGGGPAGLAATGIVKRAAKGWRELMVGSATEGRQVLLSQE